MSMVCYHRLEMLMCGIIGTHVEKHSTICIIPSLVGLLTYFTDNDPGGSILILYSLI